MSLGGAGDLGGAVIERGLKAGGRHRDGTNDRGIGWK